ALGQRPQLHAPGTVAGAGAGPVPDHCGLRDKYVRRRAARSVRSAHARVSLSVTNKRGDVMRKGWIGLSVVALLLVITGGSARAEDEPRYGGTLEIGTVYVTLSALSWDSADWNWKHNHDTGQVYEQLFAADLSKSKRNGGKYPFYADAWLP